MDLDLGNYIALVTFEERDDHRWYSLIYNYYKTRCLHSYKGMNQWNQWIQSDSCLSNYFIMLSEQGFS